jgi:uncharacterized protein YggE
MRKLWLVTTGLMLIIGIFGLTGCGSAAGETGSITVNNQQEGIWVSGSGKVSAAPDICTLSLGVQSQDATVAAAQAKAASAMDKIMTSLTGNGVVKKDIQTQNYNISQTTKYDNNTQQQVITGYQVTNIVTATIRTLDKVGNIIDAAASAGGDLTRINSISFSIENPTTYYNDARKLAIADAKSKATQMADLAGISLGKIIYITENSYTPPVPFMISAGVKSAPDVSTPISPGEMDITSSVQITYAIK